MSEGHVKVSGAGEPGTVAVTVSDRKPGAAPSYRSEVAPGTPRLRADHLSVTYIDRVGRATEAVRDVSFAIADKPGCGEIVVFLGPSGCGKSTILKAIAGLLMPTAGTVEVDGKPIDRVGADRGMVFQAYTSFAWLTVRQNVEYGLRLRGVSKAERRERSDRYLKAVGLLEFADHYPKQLSGGMKQRVAIARTLINQPRIVLMDEPFGALDPLTRDALGREYRAVHERLGLTTLMVTHDVLEAVLLADRIVVLRAGEIVADGTPRELMNDRRDAAVHALMDTPRRQALRVAALLDDGAA